jgi:hypothetical protein
MQLYIFFENYYLELGGECSLLPLLIPGFYPLLWAHGCEILEEEFARSVILATKVGAPVEVHVVLPAVPGKGDYGGLMTS